VGDACEHRRFNAVLFVAAESLTTELQQDPLVAGRNFYLPRAALSRRPSKEGCNSPCYASA
jgi:hypothetical protein